VRTHGWAPLAFDDAVGAAAAAAAGGVCAAGRAYNEPHALQDGEPPAFAHFTQLHVVAAADDGDDGAALAVVWGGMSHEPLSAARAPGAAMRRMLANGAMRVMRIEPAPEKNA
jgi:hypothetical protein